MWLPSLLHLKSAEIDSSSKQCNFWNAYCGLLISQLLDILVSSWFWNARGEEVMQAFPKIKFLCSVEEGFANLKQLRTIDLQDMHLLRGSPDMLVHNTNLIEVNISAYRCTQCCFRAFSHFEKLCNLSVAHLEGGWKVSSFESRSCILRIPLNVYISSCSSLTANAYQDLFYGIVIPW